MHNLLLKLQHEQLLKDDAQFEHRRLRQEAQTYEQNLSRLRKEIEVKERDIATLKIRGRQEVDRHSEELAVMIRDRDALQKHCNNLTRRQIQFQHEIRRKELQYEWLQEKLRNYLAERKRESSASMEIVGLLRQQTPQPTKDRSKIASKIDEMMPGRSSNAKRSASRGPKLDETMVKMIVTAYEEKQKELMAENEDLQEALNSIRKEYANLMNAQLKAETSSRQLVRMDSKIYTTKRDSIDPQTVPEDSSKAPTAFKTTAVASKIPTLSRCNSGISTSSSSELHRSGSSALMSTTINEDEEMNGIDSSNNMIGGSSGKEDVRRKAELPDPVPNANHPDLVPWPIAPADAQLQSVKDQSETEGPSILDTSENIPVLPTVTEEHETLDSAKATPRAEEVAPIAAAQLEQQTDLVITSISAKPSTLAVHENDNSIKQSKSMPGQDAGQSSPGNESEESPEKKSPVIKTPKKAAFGAAVSSESGSPEIPRLKSTRLTWPPPSTSPQPRDEPSPQRPRPALGKLPQPSNKPMPNIALLTDEQLKTELRSRAVDVEEAVRALKTACTSMQPQHMKSVMEKRLHVELTMAANLAQQQEAVVNLALAGLEKVKRTIPGSDIDLEELASTVGTSITKSEDLLTNMMQTLDTADADTMRQNFEAIMTEFQHLRAKTMPKQSTAATKDTATATNRSRSLEQNLSSLKERADGLTKERELITRALGEFDQVDPPLSRRTWAEKAEQQQQEPTDAFSDDSYSDDESSSIKTLSQILKSMEC